MRGILEGVANIGRWAIEFITDAWRDDRPLAVLMFISGFIFIVASLTMMARQLTGNW